MRQSGMIQGKQRHWITFLRIRELGGFGVILGGFIFWDLFFEGYFYYSGPIPNLLPPTW